MTEHISKKVSRRTALMVGLAATAAACSSGSDTISLGDGGIPVPAPEGDAPEAGSDAVDFSYVTFEGEELVFSNFSDGPVVLNFFASWCPTCIAELPDFQTVSENLAGDVTFLGLATQTGQKPPTNSSRTPVSNSTSVVTQMVRFSTFSKVWACPQRFSLTLTALSPTCTLECSTLNR